MLYKIGRYRIRVCLLSLYVERTNSGGVPSVSPLNPMIILRFFQAHQVKDLLKWNHHLFLS